MTTQIEHLTVSTAELCEVLALTQGRLSQLTSAGILIKEARGKFKLVESIRNYVRFLRSGSLGGSAPKTVEDYRMGRARLVALQADLAQLQLEKERKELIPIEHAVDVIRECFMAARAKWLAAPTRYAAQIAPNDPPRAFKVLTEVVNEVLRELSDEAAAEAVQESAK